MKTFFAAIGFAVFIVALILFAVCNDDDHENSFGRAEVERQLAVHQAGVDALHAELASHYRGGPDCYQYGDCRDDEQYDNDGEDNRRGGISPGPFDRSPVDIRDNRLVVCFPFSRCDGRDGEQQPPAEER